MRSSVLGVSDDAFATDGCFDACGTAKTSGEGRLRVTKASIDAMTLSLMQWTGQKMMLPPCKTGASQHSMQGHLRH